MRWMVLCIFSNWIARIPKVRVRVHKWDKTHLRYQEMLRLKPLQVWDGCLVGASLACLHASFCSEPGQQRSQLFQQVINGVSLQGWPGLQARLMWQMIEEFSSEFARTRSITMRRISQPMGTSHEGTEDQTSKSCPAGLVLEAGAADWPIFELVAPCLGNEHSVAGEWSPNSFSPGCFHETAGGGFNDEHGGVPRTSDKWNADRQRQEKKFQLQTNYINRYVYILIYLEYEYIVIKKLVWCSARVMPVPDWCLRDPLCFLMLLWIKAAHGAVLKSGRWTGEDDVFLEPPECTKLTRGTKETTGMRQWKSGSDFGCEAYH